jgi:hypothetical protein
MPNWWSKRFLTPIDFRYLWFGKGPQAYIDAFHKLGFNDICTCVDEPGESRMTRGVRRAGSGDTGQLECNYCGMLLFPFQHLYACDECTEPVLADKYPVSTKGDFLCDECK